MPEALQNYLENTRHFYNFGNLSRILRPLKSLCKCQKHLKNKVGNIKVCRYINLATMQIATQRLSKCQSMFFVGI